MPALEIQAYCSGAPGVHRVLGVAAALQLLQELGEEGIGVLHRLGVGRPAPVLDGVVLASVGAPSKRTCSAENAVAAS